MARTAGNSGAVPCDKSPLAAVMKIPGWSYEPPYAYTTDENPWCPFDTVTDSSIP